MVINPALSLPGVSLPAGTVNNLYLQSLSATGGSGGYVFSTTSTLPAGLSLSPGGVLGGIPGVGTGSPVSITVKVTDSNGDTITQAYSLTINPAVAVFPTTLSIGVVGTAYPKTNFFGSGGNSGPYTLSENGFLPTGLSFSPSYLLSGTPTAPGAFNFTVTATDSNGGTDSQNYTLVVNPALSLPMAPLPTATVGNPYNQIIVASGGSGGYSFSTTSSLPPGLTLTPSGQLTGLPTLNSNSPFSFSSTVASHILMQVLI